MKKNTFKPNEELLAFAKDFSSNYKKLKAGDYLSKRGRYAVKYMDKIKDKDTGRVVHTAARVSSKTGVIEFDRKWFLKQKRVTGNFVFYLIIWHAVMKRIHDGGNPSCMQADAMTNELYIKEGRSKKDIVVGWLEVFSYANSDFNGQRYMEMNKMLLNAQAAEMKRLKSRKRK